MKAQPFHQCLHILNIFIYYTRLLATKICASNHAHSSSVSSANALSKVQGFLIPQPLYICFLITVNRVHINTYYSLLRYTRSKVKNIKLDAVVILRTNLRLGWKSKWWQSCELSAFSDDLLFETRDWNWYVRTIWLSIQWKLLFFLLFIQIRIC